MFGDVEPFQLQYGRTSKSYARGAMNGLSRDVNADIAGPGGVVIYPSFFRSIARWQEAVSVSYIMQATIILSI